jgi:hypothetical protein
MYANGAHVSFSQYCAVSSAFTIVAYLVDTSYKRGGKVWPSFQRMAVWKRFSDFFNGKVTVEEPLDDQQLYIFCSFPHGTSTNIDTITLLGC